MFFRAAGRDVTFFFRGEAGDLLDRFFEANDLELGRRVADKLAIRGGAAGGGSGLFTEFRVVRRESLILVSAFLVLG